MFVVGLLAITACKFPQPTRPENSGRNSSNSSSAKEEVQGSSNPKDLQKQLQELKADQVSTNEDWDQKLRSLQDKIDILEHNYQETKRQDEKIHQDIDQRLMAIEKRGIEPTHVSSAPAAAPATAAVVTAPKSTGGEITGGVTPEKNIASPTEQQYQTILDTFLEQKNYNQAIRDFKKFIQNNPKDPLAGNAQYWIGEGYYSKSDWPKAITEFQKVIDNYPNSTKKCDTLLKQGMAFANMKDPSNAKLFLKETVDQCPGTVAADKAKKLL